MSGVNKVIVVGRVGQDPEVKMTPSGHKVATLSIATSEKYTDGQGNKNEKTEWHNVVAWRKLAEIIEQWVKKGSQIYIEGKLETRSWDDQNGQKRYRTEIIANNITMLGGGDQNSGGGYGQQKQEGFGGQQPVDDEELPF